MTTTPDAAAPLHLQLRLTGTPEIASEGRPGFALALRDAALLAWLAIEGPTPRARLAALFWPASGELQARATLRQRLFQLRKALGRDLVVGKTVLQLADGLSHDLHDAVDFLGSNRLPDAPEVDDWLEAQRQLRSRREADALAAQADALEQAGDLAAASALARTLLRIEPLSELAHRRLIRLLYLAGDRAAALAAFDACEQQLKDELNARPSPETLALLATVEQAGAAAAAPALRTLPAAVLRPPRMVGRRAAFTALQDAWNAGHIAAVVGEAGMGKSRLLAEFGAPLTGVVGAAGRPGDAAVPFATLARLLRAVGAGQAALISADDRRQVARVLPELAPAGAPFPEGQRLHLQRAIVAYLQAAPGLQGLFLDDLHYADDASLEMLQALLPELAPLRWVLACRPAEAASPLRLLEEALAESAQLVRIAVEPLDEPGLAELVDELGLGLDGRRLAPELLRRTGGNPLFVLETLKQAWVERGIERLAQGGPLPRAASVEQMIARRLTQLAPDALALARVASLAGLDFSIDVAEQVLHKGAIYLVDALNELEAAQVLRGTQFAHDLILDGVRRGIPAAVAAIIHGKIALWLEQHEGEPARIARHWVAAGRPASALPWLGQAADRAATALRNIDRLAFLDEQSTIAAALGQRALAYASGHQALQVAMSHTYAPADLQPRIDRLETLAQTAQEQVQLVTTQAQLHMHRREIEPALAAARRALQLARQWGDAPTIGRCEVTLFEQLGHADQLDAALVQARACEAWAAKTDDLEWLARYFHVLATVQEQTGQIEAARHAHERALALCEQRGELENQSVTANNLAVNRREAGELRLAVHFGLQALQLATRYEASQVGMGPTCVNLTEAYAQLGCYNDALRWADEAERRLASAIPGAVSLANAHRASIFWQLGQPARTRQLVAQIAADAAAILPARVRRHQLAARLARADGRSGRAELEAGLADLGPGGRAGLCALLQLELAADLGGAAALALLESVRALAAAHGRRGQVLESHVRAAPVAAALDPVLARHHVEQALALAQQVDLVGIYRGTLWLNCGQALQAIGDAGPARAVLREGADWVRRTAANDMPEAFRDSFLHRNPVNAALLALVETGP